MTGRFGINRSNNALSGRPPGKVPYNQPRPWINRFVGIERQVILDRRLDVCNRLAIRQVHLCQRERARQKMHMTVMQARRNRRAAGINALGFCCG